MATTSKTHRAAQLTQSLRNRTDQWGDSKFPAAKAWSNGAGLVRVYTGHKSEFVTIDEDSCTANRTNMTWGSDVAEAIKEAN